MTREKRIGALDISSEDIHWKVKDGLSYGKYLNLDRILSAQTPLSTHRDEMLFIVIHQTSELWLKLCLNELEGVFRQLATDDPRPAFKMLSRVARVQEQLVQSWDVLSTLTPFDYMQFRDALGQSSGFQSYQYRALEFMLGNKTARMIDVHKGTPEIYEYLRGVLERPSIYDESLRLLARRGFDIPTAKTERDWALPYEADEKVEAAWLTIYRDAETYWDLYELAEKLVDLEHKFALWRFSHMKTVERIIGHKRGTGGTSGVSYLVKALDLRFFPELWTVRTAI